MFNHIAKRLTLVLAIITTCHFSAFGQAELRGTVIDSSGTRLPGAYVILMQSLDSKTIASASTDNQGAFKILGVPPGTYIFRTSFIVFEHPDRIIKIGANDQYPDFGKIKMYETGFLLKGVEVTADKLAVQMRGDTMLSMQKPLHLEKMRL